MKRIFLSVLSYCVQSSFQMQPKNLFTGIQVFLLLACAIQTFAQKQEYPFPLQVQEQVISNKLISSKYMAFLVKFNLKQKYTLLKAVAYSSSNRQKLQEITIDSAIIKPWQSPPTKGTVRQTFENAVLSGQRTDTQAPLEYQYQINYSPDNKTILCYRYDYSQPDLYIKCILLNAELEVLQTFELPVDAGKTNHGVYVTHAGNVCILNTDAADGIELIQYEPATGNASLIEISASSTSRNNFKLVFMPEDQLYLAAISESNGNLTGLLCYGLNLKTSRVEESYFFALSKQMLVTINGFPGKGRYNLIQFIPQENSFSFELQKRNIAATDYVYDPYAVNDLLQWKSRKMQVQTGEKLLLSYNAESQIVSEKVVEGMETY